MDVAAPDFTTPPKAPTLFTPAGSGDHRLTGDEFWLFRHNGFLRLRQQLPASVVQRLRDVVIDEFLLGTPPLRRNAAGQVHRIDRLLGRDPLWFEALRRPEIAEPLEGLLGPNVVALQNRHNDATTNRAGETPYRLHRDVVQWSRPVVTLVVCLEETTVDSGCTHVVPGSHLAAFAGMAPDGGGGNWADEHPEYRSLLHQALPVPMPAGGLLLFDSLLFHSVGTNRTAGTRLSATFAFRSTDELEKVPGEDQVLVLGEHIYKGNDRHY